MLSCKTSRPGAQKELGVQERPGRVCGTFVTATAALRGSGSATRLAVAARGCLQPAHKVRLPQELSARHLLDRRHVVGKGGDVVRVLADDRAACAGRRRRSAGDVRLGQGWLAEGARGGREHIGWSGPASAPTGARIFARKPSSMHSISITTCVGGGKQRTQAAGRAAARLCGLGAPRRRPASRSRRCRGAPDL